MILPKICLALKLRRAIEDGLGKREAKAMAKEAPDCLQICFQYVSRCFLRGFHSLTTW